MGGGIILWLKGACDEDGAYELDAEVGRSMAVYPDGGPYWLEGAPPARGDVTRGGGAPTLGGGATGGVDFCLAPYEAAIGGGGGCEGIDCCPGTWDDAIVGGGGPGVFLRDVGGFTKPSGMSFQFGVFAAFDGGGMPGDWFRSRRGGGATGCC